MLLLIDIAFGDEQMNVETVNAPRVSPCRLDALATIRAEKEEKFGKIIALVGR
jgi:hypothetical protein